MQTDRLPEQNLLTLSQVSLRTQIPEHLLLYWNRYLELPVTVTDQQQPCYSQEDLRLLYCIAKLLKARVSLATIRHILPWLLQARTMLSLKQQLQFLKAHPPL